MRISDWSSDVCSSDLAILDGQLPPGDPLPSCRRLAGMLNIARNTVMLAYQSLVDEGFLEARERSGYYVADDIMAGRAATPTAGKRTAAADGVDWSARFRQRPSEQRNILQHKDRSEEHTSELQSL